MRLETAMAIEDLKEDIVKILRNKCLPEYLEKAKEEIWERIDACVELTRMDEEASTKMVKMEANFDEEAFHITMATRELNLWAAAWQLLLALHCKWNHQLETLGSDSRVEAITATCNAELLQCMEKLNAAKDSLDEKIPYDQHRRMKPGDFDHVATAKFMLRMCKEGYFVPVPLLQQMFDLKWITHDQVGTTPEEVEQFIQQWNQRKARGEEF